MKSYLALLVICTGMLAGCATTTVQGERALSEDECVVYLIRVHAEPTAWKLLFSLDGKHVASLANRDYCKIYVPEGNHTLSARWPLASMMHLDWSQNMPFMRHRDRFFVVSGKVRVSGVYPVKPIMVYTFNEELALEEVPSDEGMEIIDELDRRKRPGG